MAFFTKSEARAAAARNRGLQKSAGIPSGRILTESVTAATAADSFDVFLSHSIADAEIVLGIKQLLEESGLKVYVDPRRPPKVLHLWPPKLLHPGRGDLTH